MVINTIKYIIVKIIKRCGINVMNIHKDKNSHLLSLILITLLLISAESFGAVSCSDLG